MNIVDRETFLRMPAGTIFAEYKPCVFIGGFQIKTDTGHMVENPMFGKPFWSFLGSMPLEPYFKGFDGGGGPFTFGSYPVEWCVYDDSSADYFETDMIAIFEPHEVTQLIEVLKWALNGCAGEVKTGVMSDGK